MPSYLAKPECGRYYVNSASSLKYDTGKSPAWLYPLDGNRYTVGFDPEHQGGDVWAADAAIATMKNERSGAACSSRFPVSTRPRTCGAASTTPAAPCR